MDRKARRLGSTRLDRQRAWATVKRRAQKAAIETTGICNHTFRGTGITAYLENPEAKLEHAQQMAAHSDPRPLASTTGAAMTSPWAKSRGLGFR